MKPNDPNELLEPVSSRYGAPMGRNSLTDDPAATVTLFRVRFVDGDYDAGGAYWGSGTPLYAAIGEDFRYFLRADSLAEARQELLSGYPDLKIETGELNDDFFAAYVAAALWSSTDDNGDPLDREFSVDDISPQCLEKMRFDCRDFWVQAGELLCLEHCNADKWEEQAGHDFWLTRNGHGCGFWDGDWQEPSATVLTALAQKFGEVYLYAIDGKVECD